MTNTSSLGGPYLPVQEPVKLAEKAHLRYVTDKMPGLKRIKNGDTFIYRDQKDNEVKNKEILERIKSLAIPPAWTNVWICPFDYGHIQATGKDEKGRKQYKYHEKWNIISQENKFEKLLFFSTILPELRKKVASDMKLPGFPKIKITATTIWLLEHTYIRIGNNEYAKENKHYGLTTMRSKHVSVEGQKVTFTYVGKSGKEHTVDVSHPHVARIIQKLEDLPGYELFQYIEDGQRKVLSSEDVNAYLQAIAGEPVSAKDFRTWGGTVIAGKTLYDIGDFSSQRQAQRNITLSVKRVSQLLHNTPTVCKTYYIHPTITQTYKDAILIPHFSKIKKEYIPSILSFEEIAIKTLLENYSLR